MNDPSIAAMLANPPGIIVCDPARTAALLGFEQLVEALGRAVRELAAGSILSPERMVVPLGEGGVLLSMPASAPDIAIHKLVNVQQANARRHLPTLHGNVTVCDAATGRLLCLLDGPEVTGRRTAAVTLLALRTFLPQPVQRILIFGTGAQSRFHVQAINALYPQARIWVRGLDLASATQFCEANRQWHGQLQPLDGDMPEVDAVITLTTSLEPVYNQPARVGCLVVGVGAFKPEMAELGKALLDGSLIYADDPAGARHEAGDLLRAAVDWSQVKSLASALDGAVEPGRPVVVKSVGTAAWDLAAARVALANLMAERA